MTSIASKGKRIFFGLYGQLVGLPFFVWCGGPPYFSNLVSVNEAQTMIKTNTLKIYTYQAWTPTAGIDYRGKLPRFAPQ